MKVNNNISLVNNLKQGIARVGMFLLFVCLCHASIAQKKTIQNALRALQANELEKAQLYIDSASTHEETKNESATWYYRAFIYRKLYGAKEESDKESKMRLEAINSFKRFFELDTLSELHETAFKSTKFLASTLYNDAANALNEAKFDVAIGNFEKYKETMRMISPNHDFYSLEVQFYLVLGQQYDQMYEKDREGNQAYLAKTEETYGHVIKMDSLNMSANYNMGILYYNEGVNIIKNLDYDLDLITLELIQDEVINLFSKSKPFMITAYDLDLCREETLIGLSGIFFSLNEMERSQKIQDQLEYVRNPYELVKYGGTTTEESFINYLPICNTARKYLVKVVKASDEKYYRVDDKKYLPKKGKYIEIQ